MNKELINRLTDLEKQLNELQEERKSLDKVKNNSEEILALDQNIKDLEEKKLLFKSLKKQFKKGIKAILIGIPISILAFMFSMSIANVAAFEAIYDILYKIFCLAFPLFLEVYISLLGFEDYTHSKKELKSLTLKEIEKQLEESKLKKEEYEKKQAYKFHLNHAKTVELDEKKIKLSKQMDKLLLELYKDEDIKNMIVDDSIKNNGLEHISNLLEAREKTKKIGQLK